MSQSATPNGLERAAVRKLIYEIAEVDGVTVDPDATLADAAREAAEQVKTIQQRLDAVEDKLAELDARAPDPAQREYDALDKPAKVTVLQQKLREVAINTNGRASMKYDDVLRVFDGHPSAGHAYDLMDAAGNGDGFEYGESPDGSKRLTVDLQQTDS